MAQQPAKPVTTFRTTAKTTQPEAPVNFIFNKDNYKLFIIAIAIVALGFVLMAGTTDIYSNTKIVVAPIVVLAGFGVGFYAILRKPASKA
ncbi:DUF3098 domain-containing protein [Mucilaginibacter roseus]|uniref:DUF3098 domain-containing protein n=1 Tax=Mucilaginibacter roseus TaxID=1528868 RepID=A0ABS8U6A0_9SPHI|nr:DUF3098 domain-containing protein [Mucilaginibacter roseus]MCD8741374.1 DUF3098 domain-containing protein [Mucilaginibacter roseus]